MILELVEERLKLRSRILKSAGVDLGDDFKQRLDTLLDEDTIVFLIEMIGYSFYKSVEFIGKFTKKIKLNIFFSKTRFFSPTRISEKIFDKFLKFSYKSFSLR